MSMEAKCNMTDSATTPADVGETLASEPLWAWQGRSRRHRLTGHAAAALALLSGIAVPVPSVAQTEPAPRLGMPGFARGFEGFFDDNGYRTPDDEKRRPARIQPARPEWTCRLYEELPTFERTEGPITINNVSLRSDTGFLSGLRYAELSFSLVNRSREPQFPSIQFIVYDTQTPMPALVFSSQPLMGMIEGQSTEQVTASVNMRAGELDSLVRFCMRVDG